MQNRVMLKMLRPLQATLFFSFSQTLLARWNVLKEPTFSWCTCPEIAILLELFFFFADLRRNKGL